MESPRRATAVVAAGAFVLQLALIVVYLGGNPYATHFVADAHSYHELALRWSDGGLGDEGVFHQAPLFPALLALTYAVVDESTRTLAALLLQALLHTAAVALLVPLARLWFGSTRIGVYAAGLTLLHGPVAFYALKLLPVSLALATQGAALTALGWTRLRPSPLPAAATGFACGVAALARPEALLLVPIAAVAVAQPARGRHRLQLAAALLAGALAALSPALWHNARNGDFVPVASSGGENLFIGNQRGATGTYKALTPAATDIFAQRRAASAIPERELGRRLRPSEASAYWRGRALDEIRADPLGWLRLEAAKLGLVLHPGEPPEIYSLAMERERYLWPLWALPVGAWTVFVLAGVGLGIGARGHLGRRWPLLAFLAVHLAVLLAFFVDGRLRLPWVVFLTPFAGLAVESAFERWRAGKRRWVAAVVGTALFATLVGTWATQPRPRDRRRIAAVLSIQERLDESLAALAPELERPHTDPLILELAAFVHEKRGDDASARTEYERALAGDALEPHKRVQVLTRLAGVLARLGETGAAATAFDTAVASGFANAETYYRRGLFRLAIGDAAGARRDLETAARIDPGWPPPRETLRRLGPSGASPGDR